MRHLKVPRGVLAASVATCLLAACGEEEPEPPSRETVLPLLQQEAASLKQEGENISPKLEVEMTWNIDAVDVRAQPNDAQFPWSGTIHVTIVARIKELDGYVTEETKKNFDYTWDMNLEKWLAQ